MNPQRSADTVRPIHSPDGTCGRFVALRLLRPEKVSPGYDEGWNDALYLLLDILDGEHPDGTPGASEGK